MHMYVHVEVLRTWCVRNPEIPTLRCPMSRAGTPILLFAFLTTSAWPPSLVVGCLFTMSAVTYYFLVYCSCVCCSSFVRVKVKGQVSGLAVCMVDEEPRIQDAAKVFFHKYSEVSLVLTTHTPTHPQTCACPRCCAARPFTAIFHVFCLTFSQNRASYS